MPHTATKEVRKWLDIAVKCGGVIFSPDTLIIDGEEILRFVEAIRQEVLREQART